MALAVVALLMGAPYPLLANEVYKTIDAEGHGVYSDRAATSTAPKSTIRVDQPDPSEVARNAKEQAILKAEETQRRKQQSVEDARKAQAEHDNQVQCENARSRYFSMKDARRIYRRDENGNRIYYTDAEGDAKREEARQAMASACDT